ncbi:hypothetical protein HPB50_027431 [Hyalomma asiaticum]|uniref:Uncharacterized protein n=2 Tax=Hyalomma asiaticum TaxID=266040 RepID=A0ACB7SJ43_HYAAI|nr:hypothetical protein HPB50_007314 [Hyalomma asiaticum]KAH6934720.1 hypothetical protein HPB50_027431 [Hyalomma asiaticum]
MAAETVITQSRKRVRLEQQSTSGPLVSLQAILSLANETQRCVNEGEATFNAGHVVCCGIKSSTDTEVSVESLCLQTSAIKGPPHCVNVTVRQDTGSVKDKQRQPGFTLVHRRPAAVGPYCLILLV